MPKPDRELQRVKGFLYIILGGVASVILTLCVRQGQLTLPGSRYQTGLTLHRGDPYFNNAAWAGAAICIAFLAAGTWNLIASKRNL